VHARWVKDPTSNVKAAVLNRLDTCSPKFQDAMNSEVYREMSSWLPAGYISVSISLFHIPPYWHTPDSESGESEGVQDVAGRMLDDVQIHQ
jgi:hypothetical protein